MAGFAAAPKQGLRAREHVLAGLFAAVPALVLGVALTVVLERAGLLAQISGVATSAGAVWLYTMGARSVPQLGLVPLFLEIVLGLVASFFGLVANGLWNAYEVVGGLHGQSRSGYVVAHLLDHHLIAIYLSRQDGLFAVFAVVGILLTMIRLRPS